jgi:hypothetical protein
MQRSNVLFRICAQAFRRILQPFGFWRRRSAQMADLKKARLIGAPNTPIGEVAEIRSQRDGNALLNL